MANAPDPVCNPSFSRSPPNTHAKAVRKNRQTILAPDNVYTGDILFRAIRSYLCALTGRLLPPGGNRMANLAVRVCED